MNNNTIIIANRLIDISYKHNHKELSSRLLREFGFTTIDEVDDFTFVDDGKIFISVGIITDGIDRTFEVIIKENDTKTTYLRRWQEL